MRSDYYMKTLFLLLDACKSSYVTPENMPFLSKLAKDYRYIEKIIPSPGYCERSEIFTGLNCCDSGNFTAIGYDRNRSEYNNEFVMTVADVGACVYKRGTKFLLQKFRNHKGIMMQPYYIPPKLLKYFFLTEDGGSRLKEYETLFDVLEREKITYCLQGFTSLSNTTYKNEGIVPFIKKAFDKKYDFIPIYIGITDIIGHQFGDDLNSIRPFLLKLDSMLELIYQMCKRNKYALCILGDHGMVPVTKNIDIKKIIKLDGMTQERDYISFLDSTYARFWVKSDAVRQELRGTMQEKLNELGVLIDSSNYTDFSIPFNLMNSHGERIYGDLIWCANPGILIFPDYFNSPYKKRMDKGMHGYLKNVDDSYGFFVSTMNEKKSKYKKLTDVCIEICCALNCSIPNDSKIEDIDG